MVKQEEEKVKEKIYVNKLLKISLFVNIWLINSNIQKEINNCYRKQFFL